MTDMTFFILRYRYEYFVVAKWYFSLVIKIITVSIFILVSGTYINFIVAINSFGTVPRFSLLLIGLMAPAPVI